MSVHARRLLTGCAGLFVLGVLTSSCSSSKPAPALSTPCAPALWGELKPVVSVKELMRDMIDPASDYIFNAVSTVDTKHGIVERGPKTDEDWEKLQIGAVTLAEGVYLLKIPRPFAPPGDLNNSTGPAAVELAPAQLTANLQRERPINVDEEFRVAEARMFRIFLQFGIVENLERHGVSIS